MPTEENGYGRSINGICYVEFRQSLKVKYLWLFKGFSLLRKTLEGVASSFHFFSLFHWRRYSTTPVVR